VKRRIQVLGILSLVAVALAVWAAVWAVRQMQSSRVSEASGQMARALSHLVERHRYLRQSYEQQGSGGPLTSGDEDVLRALTEAAFGGIPGVEGGFYRPGDGRFLGYAYPTYQGSGPKTDVPQAEAPTIQRVVRRALIESGVVEERIDAGTDVLLFQARPVAEGGAPVGAAWAMQRLGRAFGIRGQLYTTNTLAALAVSAAAVVGAWLLARRLDRGVAGIIRDVRGMEGQLEGAVTAVGIPELDEIGAAINRLAQTVKESQAGHMAVEARLRRAERLAALGRLVAGLAHEVRNPLASIRLKLHLARRSSTDPERLGVAFSVIEEEMERLDRLVDRLLTLTKSPEPHRLPTELDALLRSRADLWEGRTTEQGIVIELRPPASGAGSVLVDGDRVAQILDNLLANAVQALNGRGGRITLTLERPSRDEVLLEVADTGPGVPPDLVERLFEPFFTTRPGGTGLGLFLSAELARVLGGEIRYRAQPGGGACFEVRLPC